MLSLVKLWPSTNLFVCVCCLFIARLYLPDWSEFGALQELAISPCVAFKNGIGAIDFNSPKQLTGMSGFGESTRGCWVFARGTVDRHIGHSRMSRKGWASSWRGLRITTCQRLQSCYHCFSESPTHHTGGHLSDGRTEWLLRLLYTVLWSSPRVAFFNAFMSVCNFYVNIIVIVRLRKNVAVICWLVFKKTCVF